MSQWSDPFDELAALFLTEPDGRESIATAAPALIELLVVGSLPVRASLWVTAYADALARSLGPTALVRLDGDAPTFQVLRGPTPSAERYPTLALAIADLSPQIALWIVRPALDAVPADYVQSGCGRITILTSDNETARVDAYQRAKSLVEAAEAGGAEPPKLGVAIAGTDPDGAAAAQDKLSRAAREYLAVELPLVTSVHRMDSAIRSADVLLSSPGARPSLAAVLGWIRQAGDGEADTAPAEPAARAPVELDARAPAAKIPQPQPSRAPTPGMKLPPKPSIELEPKTVKAREPDDGGAPVALAGYVQDVTPLDVRCPGNERVEIGVDVAGRLHVIARERDMRHLQVVEAWARAHRELISRASPDQWIDPTGKTVCHVFTDQPATVADLHGCDLRLHVLAPVTIDGKQGWYAAPLNAVVR